MLAMQLHVGPTPTSFPSLERALLEQALHLASPQLHWDFPARLEPGADNHFAGNILGAADKRRQLDQGRPFPPVPASQRRWPPLALPQSTGSCSLWLPKSSRRRVICEATYGGQALVGHVHLCIYSTEVSAWQK